MPIRTLRMFRQWKNFFRTQGRDSRFVPGLFTAGPRAGARRAPAGF